MVKKPQVTPNTYMGEVYFWGDAFFGTYLWMVQQMIGLQSSKDRRALHFQEAFRRQKASELWKFFYDNAMDNGNMYLEFCLDENLTFPVATIETIWPAEEEIPDEQFVRLINDFVEHVRNQPLIDPDDRVGATWTDEDIERGYSEAENNEYLKAMSRISKKFEEADQRIFGKKKK